MPAQSCAAARAALFALAFLSMACASQHAAEREASHRTSSRPAAIDLQIALLALSPKVSRVEARGVALFATRAAGELADEYKVVGSPHLQNFLVNVGAKRRGLCFHWTEDLTRRLEALQLRTLDLHWATARGGTWREHNAVVVTARGQPFAEGVVLDAWRAPGRLHWSRVRSDHYPWEKDESDYMRRIANPRRAAQP